MLTWKWPPYSGEFNWEHIGRCGIGRMPGDYHWIEFDLHTGIMYLRHACGARPESTFLAVVLNEPETGPHPLIVLGSYGYPFSSVEHDYVERAAQALTILDRATDWAALKASCIPW